MSEPVVPTVDKNNEDDNTVQEDRTSDSNKRPIEDSGKEERDPKTPKLDTEPSEKPIEPPKTDSTNDKADEEDKPSDEVTGKPAEAEKTATDANVPNPPLLNLAQGAHPPPPGLHLLSNPQQQQLLHSYVQAQGQDLANLTASSLAQAMVSPITVPNLASNLLQQLQQSGNIITALPGPPPQLPHQPPTITPHNAPLADDAQGTNKRSNVRGMSNDERRQRRLLRNRVAAKECRKKKKKHIQDMEERIVQLEEENAKLAKEVEELKAKLSLGNLQNPENFRLMKQVEELNAKLSINGPLPPGGVLSTVMAPQETTSQSTSNPVISPSSDASSTTPVVEPSESPESTSEFNSELNDNNLQAASASTSTSAATTTAST